MQIGGDSIDPQQELFTALRNSLKESYDVYDGALPPAGTPYPFVYLGETTLQDNYGNKSAIFATVNITVHVWHNNFNKRGTVSAMLKDIKEKARALDTPSYSFHVSNIYQRTLEDNTTKTPLMHGVLEIEFTLGG